MALPSGALTATVTVGAAMAHDGTAGYLVSLQVWPEVPAGLVWAAGGTMIEPWSADGSGTLTILADQPGVLTSGTVDGAPQMVAIRSWPLVAEWRTKPSADAAPTKHYRRFAAPAPGTTVDLDLLPQDGALPVATITYAQTLTLDRDYSSLTGTPTLGTAAATDATDYATAAQGAKADASDVAAITLTAPLALTVPAGYPVGQVYRVAFTQDGTGGHTVTYDDQPVTVDTTAGAVTTVELHPAGAGYVVRYPSAAPAAPLAGRILRADMQTFTVDVDVDEAIAVIGQNPVEITTYAGAPNSIVHPSVLFFPEGWQGWRYWMAYTPFNGGDSQVENPSIAVSNDGDTWTVPNGLINPIEPSPPGADYNADACLCMSADGTRLLMVWKRTNVAQRETCLRTSTDGVTWTDRVVLFSNTFEDASPALLWDGDRYRMWTIKHADTPNTMYLRTATDPAGPWSAPVACSTPLPAGVEPWHIDVKRVGQQYHLVMQMASSNQFFFAKSNDGVNWVFGAKFLMRPMTSPQSAFYKACIVPKGTPDGLAYDMWYTATGTWTLYRTTITFDRTSKLRDINSGILSAVAGLSPWVLADNFDRADTTAELGTSNSGHVWSSVLGNVMGIASGKAYLPVAANSRSIVDAGVADFKVGVTVSTLGTSCYLLFRYVDSLNLWRVGHNFGILLVQKIVAGVLITLTGHAGKMEAGDRLEVQCRGADIRVYINGLQIFQTTDAANQAGTKVGLNIDNTTARFDNLTARTL